MFRSYFVEYDGKCRRDFAQFVRAFTLYRTQGAAHCTGWGG